MSDQPNFPPTGDLRPLAEIMPRTRASIPTPLPRHSPTTSAKDEGGTKNALTPAGSGDGVCGATPMPTGDSRLARAFGLPAPAAKLLPLLEQLLVWGETSLFGSHGWEGTRITDVAVRSSASAADVDRLLGAFNHLCKPASAELAAKKLTELRMLTAHRARDGVDVELMAGAYTERLAQYPADVVVAACDAWLNGNSFWPTWAELKNECDKRMRGRSQIRAALVTAHLAAAHHRKIAGNG